ncbi:hypothetical protein HWV62_9727 [Athelia sp. TMB]|nr:hypothetical protein HWV62_9727 [Athelia sp. TMB]
MQISNEHQIHNGSQLQGLPESIRTVPDDVLAEIFLAFSALFVEEHRPRPGPRLALLPSPVWPILFGRVCKQWRALIVSTPCLWTKVCIDIPRPSRIDAAVKLYQLFVSRSGAHPLDITITFGGEMLPTQTGGDQTLSDESMDQYRLLVDALAHSAERWQRLSVNAPPQFLQRIEEALAERSPWSLPMLTRLDLGSTPILAWRIFTPHRDAIRLFSVAHQLRYVNLGNRFIFDNETDHLQLPWQQIEELDGILTDSHGALRLLRQCPKLLRLNLILERNCAPRHLFHVCHALRSMDLFAECEYSLQFFLMGVELGSLLDLRISLDWRWQSAAQTQLASFFSNSAALQRLCLRLRNFSPDDFRFLIRAVPRGLTELEVSHVPQDSTAASHSTIYTKELLEELTLRTPDGNPLMLLPNLRTLSLLGELHFDVGTFIAMIRSRTWDNKNGRRGGALLQSLHMYMLHGTDGLNVRDLMVLKDAMGQNARIHMAKQHNRGLYFRSVAFPELL